MTSSQPLTRARRATSPESVEAAYQAVLQNLPVVEAPLADWEASFWAWNEVKTWLAGEGSRRYYKEAQDTREPEATQAFRTYRETIVPLQEAHDGKLRAFFLDSPHRAELAARLGPQLFARLELEQAAFIPANIALVTREGEIVSQVERLYGSAELDVNGEKVGLSKANGLLNSPDEAVRKLAWDAIVAFQLANRETLHAHYDELVALRHEMALNLGEKDFTPVGYRKMGRGDYGPAEVAIFRDDIHTYVKPFLARIRQAQARALGQPTILPWNQQCFPGLSLGSNVAPVNEQLTRGSVLFNRLHPELGAHFDRMVAEGLIDLEARPGKRPGAFAIAFEDEERIAIFCNSSGAETDVTTLTHEMGHAFQGWESLRIPALEVRLATMDAAELTSMGMEYLALEEITAFFTPEQATQFARMKLINAVQRMAYVAVVDAFQHWVYAHPGHTHAEREAAWDDAWETYVPGFDFSNDPWGRRLRWVRQSHIFSSPFYYIDYAIAEVGALQLWQLSRVDRPRAMEAYMQLCRIGGTLPLRGIFEAAGLRSPFEPGMLAPLIKELEVALALEA